MVGHTPWNKTKLKTMNGNRLGEHRKSIPGIHWTLLAVAVALIFFFAKISEAQEYEPYTPYSQGTALIVQQAELCFTLEISSEAINLLNVWQQLVNELEVYERGGSAMNQEDALMGQLLYENHMCATVKEFYHVVVLRRTFGYVLVKFDEQYGFDTGPFIVAARDILPDRVL